MKQFADPFERRFLDAIEHHLDGISEKIKKDFTHKNFLKELNGLKGDKVYHDLGFDTAEYTLVRLIGRMSISVGRRLGEIYDKVPRYVAAARFGLQPNQIAEVFDGLELDIALRNSLLSDDDKIHIKKITEKMSGETYSGIGIEIRYNFNPNDSSRLRKDVDVASKLSAAGLFPVYLIFSSLSPRNDAIARLKRGGWSFKQGQEALDFLTELLGVDIGSVLSDPIIAAETREKTSKIMKSIFESEAFQSVIPGEWSKL
uniref:PciI n=1 Tax=Planococcus citreus TaxID=1373 RepID=K4LNB0_9BACL|nr:PciI [Planococcus citreus]